MRLLIPLLLALTIAAGGAPLLGMWCPANRTKAGCIMCHLGAAVRPPVLPKRIDDPGAGALRRPTAPPAPQRKGAVDARP